MSGALAPFGFDNDREAVEPLTEYRAPEVRETPPPILGERGSFADGSHKSVEARFPRPPLTPLILSLSRDLLV